MNQKVLIIEDSKPIHTLIKGRLSAEPVDIHSAYDSESGIALAASVQPDLILLDLDMPALNGLEVCRRLKAEPATHSIPVVFVTGATSAEQKLAALDLGAVDYITKPFEPAELRARVRSALRTKYLLDLLNKKAMVDGVTGLWNRKYLEQRIVAETNFSKRSGGVFTCILVDIDDFKNLSDRFGHPFGDHVLRHVAQVFQDQCRSEDFVCRFNGERFGILTPGVGVGGALCLAERLRRTVSDQPLVHGADSATITCSFGMADAGAGLMASPVPSAERELLTAKSQGLNRISAAKTVEPAPVRKSA